MIYQLFSILIFPGVLFLTIAALSAEFLDRKIYARLQNRYGPPWYQPVADLIKLLAKEEIIPSDANQRMFKMMPIFAFASAVCAFLYIPLYQCIRFIILTRIYRYSLSFNYPDAGIFYRRMVFDFALCENRLGAFAYPAVCL
jgi:formate hydrogenlyase subunit 4